MPRLLVAAALLLMTAAALFYATWVPRVASGSAPASAFSAERAMRHVREIARRPHPSGGEDHPRVRAYLVREIGALGIAAQIQETTGVGTRYPSAGRVWNILARIPGGDPGGPAVLLMAHYDAVPASPGAADDASGSAVLLETLRAIRAGRPLAHDVITLFTDAEEPGLLGAAAFVREHVWAKDVAVTLNFEARGTHGPSLMFETGPGNLDVVRVLRRVGGARATSLSATVYRSLPNDTDLSELAVLERPAMNFAFIGGVQRYHTAQDDPAHLDRGSLQHHGDQALALTRAFANGPLPRPSTGDAVFFDLPLAGLVVYPEVLAPWLAIFAMLVSIGAFLVARNREPRLLAGISMGFLGSVLTLVVTGLMGFAIAYAAHQVHTSIGSGSPEWSVVYATSTALFALAVSATAYAVARRWGTAGGLHLGVLLTWVALALIVSVILPGVSFLLAWPALAFAAAVVVRLARPESRLGAGLLWIATLLTVFILGPTLYLMVCVALGLNPVGAALLALFTGLVGLLLSPHLETIGGRPLWRLPFALAVLALLFLAAGAITVREDADHPAGASLVYAFDADSGRAWLSGASWARSARTWLVRGLQATGAQRTDSLPAWLQRDVDAGSTVSAPMSIPPLEPATVRVLKDSIVGVNRRVTLRITPSRGTRSIGLRLEGGSILAADVDERRVEVDRYRRRPRPWALTYVAPPDDGFMLALTYPEQAPPTLRLSSRRAGIPILTGMQLPQRPPGIIEAHEGDASIVYSRFIVEPR